MRKFKWISISNLLGVHSIILFLKRFFYNSVIRFTLLNTTVNTNLRKYWSSILKTGKKAKLLLCNVRSTVNTMICWPFYTSIRPVYTLVLNLGSNCALLVFANMILIQYNTIQYNISIHIILVVVFLPASPPSRSHTIDWAAEQVLAYQVIA